MRMFEEDDNSHGWCKVRDVDSKFEFDSVDKHMLEKLKLASKHAVDYAKTKLGKGRDFDSSEITIEDVTSIIYDETRVLQYLTSVINTNL